MSCVCVFSHSDGSGLCFVCVSFGWPWLQSVRWTHSESVHTECKTPSDPQMSSYTICQMCVLWANNKQNGSALEVCERDLGVHERESASKVKPFVPSLGSVSAGVLTRMNLRGHQMIKGVVKRKISSSTKWLSVAFVVLWNTTEVKQATLFKVVSIGITIVTAWCQYTVV